MLELSHILEDARKEALSQVVSSDLMPLLKVKGYKFEDLLDALADWAEENGLTKVVYYLEIAAKEAKNTNNKEFSDV